MARALAAKPDVLVCDEVTSALDSLVAEELLALLARIQNEVGLGALLKAQGKYVEALPLYKEALETRRAVLGDRHPDALTSINNLASLLQATGELDEAERLLFEAHSTAKSVLGPEHPHTRIFGVNLKGLRAVKAKRDKRLKKAKPAKVDVTPGEEYEA